MFAITTPFLITGVGSLTVRAHLTFLTLTRYIDFSCLVMSDNIDGLDATLVDPVRIAEHGEPEKTYHYPSLEGTSVDEWI